MKSQKHKFGIYIDNREKLSIQTHDPRHNRLWVYVFCVSVIIIHIHLVGSKTYRQKYWMREKWLLSFIALMDELYLLWWLWWQLFDSIDMNQKKSWLLLLCLVLCLLKCILIIKTLLTVKQTSLVLNMNRKQSINISKISNGWIIIDWLIDYYYRYIFS